LPGYDSYVADARVGSLNSGHMTSSVDPWREYRKRRNLAIFAFVGYTPFVFLIGILTMHLLHTETPFYIVAISWMAFYAIASFRWLALKCPRCGKPFFFRWWPPPNNFVFVRRCLHCGLPKYGAVSDQRLDTDQLPK